MPGRTSYKVGYKVVTARQESVVVDSDGTVHYKEKEWVKSNGTPLFVFDCWESARTFAYTESIGLRNADLEIWKCRYKPSRLQVACRSSPYQRAVIKPSSKRQAFIVRQARDFTQKQIKAWWKSDAKYLEERRSLPVAIAPQGTILATQVMLMERIG